MKRKDCFDSLKAAAAVFFAILMCIGVSCEKSERNSPKPKRNESGPKGKNVPLDIELPEAVESPTPKDKLQANLIKESKKTRPPFHAPAEAGVWLLVKR